MSLDDDDFMVKNTGQNFENDSFLKEETSARMAWVACLRGQRGSMVGVGDVGDVLAWVGWVVCLRELHASFGGMSGVVTWMACYYYSYCYY